MPQNAPRTRVARVQMPDGRIARIEVPANSTPEQALAIANRVMPKAAEKPKSHTQGFLEGITPYAMNAVRMMAKTNPIAMIAESVAGAPRRTTKDLVTGDKPRHRGAAAFLPGNVADTIEQQANKDFARSRYQGSTLGRIAGSVVGGAPTMLLPGGAAAQGAAMGLLGNTDKSAKGLVTSAGIGAAGGKIGDKVVKVASRAISPAVAPAIRTLKERGIPLTIGQIAGAGGSTTGRAIRAAENKLTSVPGVGDAILAAQGRGVTAFNKAAFNEGLAPIKGKVPEVAEAGVEHAQQAVRDAYTKALGNVRIAPDRAFADDITKASELGLTPGNFTDDFSRIMKDEVGPVLTSQPGAIRGEDIQSALRMLKGYGRQYGKLASQGSNGIPQPSARPVGAAFNDLSSSVESLVSRQAPDVLPAYNAANEAYRNVGVLRDAVSAAKVGGAGEFTPAQLSQAARANAKKFGGTHGTTDQPFFDLTRAAQDVLPSNVPNSGTADRGLLGLLLGGAGGIPAVAASGVASIPYSKPGQAAAEWLLTGRQGMTAKKLAELLERLRPLAIAGGAAGAPLLGP